MSLLERAQKGKKSKSEPKKENVSELANVLQKLLEAKSQLAKFDTNVIEMRRSREQLDKAIEALKRGNVSNSDDIKQLQQASEQLSSGIESLRQELSGIESKVNKANEIITLKPEPPDIAKNIEMIKAVAQRHEQGTDTSLGVQDKSLNMGGHQINNLEDPAGKTDAATKQYVDKKTGAIRQYGGGSSRLDGLADVVISSPTDNQPLAYHAATKQWVNQSLVVSASEVEVSELGAATYDDVQDFINQFGDRTHISGMVISDSGSGQIDVSAGTGWCKITDDINAEGKFFDYAGTTNVALTDLLTNYIYLDYNGGTPQVVVDTAGAHFYKFDHIILGCVFRNGTSVHFINSVWPGIDTAHSVKMHFFEEEGGGHRTTGLVTSSTGTRQLDITEGVIWIGLSRIAALVGGFDSSASDTWSTWYYDYNDTKWDEVTGQSVVSNSQYNLITSGDGLASLTANRYAVHWVYLDQEGDHLHLVYGQGNYTANQAEEAGVPAALPPIAATFGILIAKIIVQEGQDTMTITYPWTSVFTSSLATDHDLLAGVATSTDHTNYLLVADLENPPTEDESTKAPTSEWAFDLDAAVVKIADLENPPTEDESGKAPTSEWAFDHDADAGAHHTKYLDAEAVSAVEAAGLTMAVATYITITTPTGDHTATGWAITRTAGASLVFGNACYVGTDAKMEKALADDAAITIPATHLCLATIAEDASGLFLIEGDAYDASWSFDVGKSVYLDVSTAGLITKTMPTKATGNQVQYLGDCVETTAKIFWHPCPIIAEYA